MESPGQLPLSLSCAVHTPAEGILCAWSKCRRTFAPGRPSQVFCSGSCRVAHWREQRPLVTPTHIRQRESGSIASSLLEVLRNATDFLTVQQLAEAVGALPASVSARIRELRAKGHPILRDQLVGDTTKAHRYRLTKETA